MLQQTLALFFLVHFLCGSAGRCMSMEPPGAVPSLSGDGPTGPGQATEAAVLFWNIYNISNDNNVVTCVYIL